jgi:alpha-beta hydrolase superfamily lysophospholipase
MTFPAQVTTRDGLKLFTRHWPLPADRVPLGVACLVHGLGEHCGRYEGVAHSLNEAGWAVVAYDHRGHGKSDGPRGRLRQDDDLLHDLAAVIDSTRAAYPGLPLTLVGHSMGGLVVSRFVAALAQPPEHAPWQRPVNYCVISSPALDLGMNIIQKLLLNTVGRLTPDVAVGNGLDPNGVCNDPAVVRAYKDDPLVHDRISGRLTRFMMDSVETVHARAAAWSTPTLLLYAGADTILPPAGSARFAKAAPARMVQNKAYPHMAHEIFLEPDKAVVHQDLVDWLNRPHPSRP